MRFENYPNTWTDPDGSVLARFQQLFSFPPGFLLDELVMKHYWSELNRDIKNIYVRMNTIKNTATSYGILFSASEDNVINKEWGKFLQNFFSDNRDNLAVIVKKAEKNLPKKVRQHEDKICSRDSGVQWLTLKSFFSYDHGQ